MARNVLGALAISLTVAWTGAAPAPPPAHAAPRATPVRAPKRYDPAQKTPLLVVLHGFGSSGARIARYWGIDRLADDENFLVSYPDGTLDKNGDRFWNASDACCNLAHAAVDDVAYVASILDFAEAHYNVDKKRVFVVGHSNGGFMAHRLACELSDRIAGIVSLAGATPSEPARCQPSAPVAVLQVHGSDDTVISPRGGRLYGLPIPPYPPLAETMRVWSTRNHCAGSSAPGDALDLVKGLPGRETETERYADCRAPVELWTIRHGGHVPNLGRAWGEAFYGFLKAHPKG